MTQVKYLKYVRQTSIQWTGNNIEDIQQFLDNDYPVTEETNQQLHIHLEEGGVDVVKLGDLIAKSV